MPTGTSILGTHPLDVLNITTGSPEVATFGNCNAGALMRVYERNETSNGYLFGFCNNAFTILKGDERIAQTLVNFGSANSSNTRINVLGITSLMSIAGTLTASNMSNCISDSVTSSRSDIAASSKAVCDAYAIGSNASNLAANIIVPLGTSSVAGLVKLIDSYSSNEPNAAGTAAAVKQAYDLANANANNRVSKLGDTITGQLTVNNTLSATRLGVGTNVATSNLDVVGDINFTGNLTNRGKAFVSALPSWDGFTTSNATTFSNVGIKRTPLEGYALDVDGNINFTGNMTLNGVPYGNATGWDSKTSSYVLINSNVGIGVIPTSTTRLAIAATSGGNNVFTVDNTGTILTAGNITAFNTFSDKRLKNDIISLDRSECVTKLLDLRPVSFTWNSNATLKSSIGQPDIGFIAQEAEEVIPEAVCTQTMFDQGDIKSIKYERLLPVIVGALQNAIERIKVLEA